MLLLVLLYVFEFDEGVLSVKVFDITFLIIQLTPLFRPISEQNGDGSDNMDYHFVCLHSGRKCYFHRAHLKIIIDILHKGTIHICLIRNTRVS